MEDCSDNKEEVKTPSVVSELIDLETKYPEIYLQKAQKNHDTMLVFMQELAMVIAINKVSKHANIYLILVVIKKALTDSNITNA